MPDAAQLVVDDNEIAVFTTASFAHVRPGNYVNMRCFRESANGPWASVSAVRVGDDLSAVVTAATEVAAFAAGEETATLFAPPICTFSHRSKATEKHVAEAPVLSAELDERPEAGRRRLEGILGVPTVIVASGGQWVDAESGAVEPKLHLHWRLHVPASGADLARLREARKLVAAIGGGDPSATPISHCFRWPGSWHRKGEPKLCRIAALDMYREIDLAEALDALRIAAGEFTAKTGNGADHPAAGSGERVDVGEITKNILEGRDLHISTLKLAASYTSRGMAAGATVAALRDLMRTTPEEKRDARWQSRFDDLPRLVASAHEKYGDPFASPLGEGWEDVEEPANREEPPQTSAPDDEPLPLFELPAAATAFPVDALPDSVARPIRAIAAKVQVPLSMAAQSVLSVLALALQGHANVRLPYSDVAPISEYFVTVSETGDRKSSADREAMRGVVRDRQARSLGYDLQHADWRIRHGAWQAQENSIKKKGGTVTLAQRTEALRELGSAPRPPLKPERIISDPTTEGILKMFGEALPSLGLYTAEGSIVIGGYSMKDENVAATGGTLSALWDGERTSKARAGEGHTTIDGCRLSSHLMLQPDLATTWINNTVLTGQGLFSRELIVWPGSLKGTRSWRDPAQEDLAEINALSDRVYNILQRELPMDSTTRRLTPREVSIQAVALPAWVEFCNRIERVCAPGHPLSGMMGFGEKAGQHALRLAAIIMLADDFEALTLGPEPMRAGISLADWYVSEIVRVRGGARVFDRDDALLPAAQKLIVFLKSHPNGLPIREVLRRGPQELRTKSKLGKAVKLLNEHRWLEAGTRLLKLREVALNG